MLQNGKIAGLKCFAPLSPPPSPLETGSNYSCLSKLLAPIPVSMAKAYKFPVLELPQNLLCPPPPPVCVPFNVAKTVFCPPLVCGSKIWLPLHSVAPPPSPYIMNGPWACQTNKNCDLHWSISSYHVSWKGFQVNQKHACTGMCITERNRRILAWLEVFLFSASMNPIRCKAHCEAIIYGD